MATFKYELKYDSHWVMIDGSHPIFNLWRCEIDNGNSYVESFRKGQNPNALKVKDEHCEGVEDECY